MLKWLATAERTLSSSKALFNLFNLVEMGWDSARKRREHQTAREGRQEKDFDRRAGREHGKRRDRRKREGSIKELLADTRIPRRFYHSLRIPFHSSQTSLSNRHTL